MDRQRLVSRSVDRSLRGAHRGGWLSFARLHNQSHESSFIFRAPSILAWLSGLLSIRCRLSWALARLVYVYRKHQFRKRWCSQNANDNLCGNAFVWNSKSDIFGWKMFFELEFGWAECLRQKAIWWKSVMRKGCDCSFNTGPFGHIACNADDVVTFSEWICCFSVWK